MISTFLEEVKLAGLFGPINFMVLFLYVIAGYLLLNIE